MKVLATSAALLATAFAAWPASAQFLPLDYQVGEEGSEENAIVLDLNGTTRADNLPIFGVLFLDPLSDSSSRMYVKVDCAARQMRLSQMTANIELIEWGELNPIADAIDTAVCEGQRDFEPIWPLLNADWEAGPDPDDVPVPVRVEGYPFRTLASVYESLRRWRSALVYSRQLDSAATLYEEEKPYQAGTRSKGWVTTSLQIPAMAAYLRTAPGTRGAVDLSSVVQLGDRVFEYAALAPFENGAALPVSEPARYLMRITVDCAGRRELTSKFEYVGPSGRTSFPLTLDRLKWRNDLNGFSNSLCEGRAERNVSFAATELEAVRSARTEAGGKGR